MKNRKKPGLMETLQKMTAARIAIERGPQILYIESVCDMLTQSRFEGDLDASRILHISSVSDGEVFCEIDETVVSDYRIESTWQRSVYARKVYSRKTPLAGNADALAATRQSGQAANASVSDPAALVWDALFAARLRTALTSEKPTLGKGACVPSGTHGTQAPLPASGAASATAANV